MCNIPLSFSEVSSLSLMKLGLDPITYKYNSFCIRDIMYKETKTTGELSIRCCFLDQDRKELLPNKELVS